MPRVKLPNGQALNFPEGTSEEVMRNAIYRNFPEYATKMATKKETIESEDTEQGFLRKLPKNIAAGLAEGLRGIGNIPHALHLPYAPHFEETDFSKMFGIKDAPTLSDRLIQGLAQFAPAIAIPEAQLGKVGGLLEGIPKAGKYLKKGIEGIESAGKYIGSKIPKTSAFLSKASAQAIPQAAYGATQNENPLAGASEAALGSAAGSVLGGIIGKGINAIKAPKYTSPLSKKELVREYQIAKGTNADLGNIIENPKLQRLYENKLPKLTGEVYNNMQKTGEQITNKGNDILTHLLGKNSSENVPEQLHQILTKEFKKHKNFKNDLYEIPDDIATKEKVNFETTNFRNEANKYIDAINDTTFLKHEPDAKKIFNKLLNYKHLENSSSKSKIVDRFGKPIVTSEKKNPLTLKELNILKGKFGDYANSYGASSNASDRNAARIFGNLSRSLKSDINSSIEKHGSENLKKAYNVAEENFKKNFSPFLDKDIYKFVSGNADPETLISKFLTTSTSNDLAGKLSKLSDKLGKNESSKNLLSYGYLSRALDNQGELNPSKLSTLIGKLGKKQFETLFPDKQLRKKLIDYSSLVKKNKKSLHLMFNPETGQKALDINPQAASQIAGAIGGLLTGGPSVGLLGAVAAPVLTAKRATINARKLTSEDFRRKIINGIIGHKEIKIPKTKAGLAKSGSIYAQLKDKKQRPLEIELVKKIE